jgi:hypothetical protein
VEVDHDGVTAFIWAGLVIIDIDVSVSLEMTLIVSWYVERESDLSFIWGDGGVDRFPERRSGRSRVSETVEDHPYFH